MVISDYYWTYPKQLRCLMFIKKWNNLLDRNYLYSIMKTIFSMLKSIGGSICCQGRCPGEYSKTLMGCQINELELLSKTLKKLRTCESLNNLQKPFIHSQDHIKITILWPVTGEVLRIALKNNPGLPIRCSIWRAGDMLRYRRATIGVWNKSELCGPVIFSERDCRVCAQPAPLC